MWARPSPYPTQDIERPALPSLAPVFVRITPNVTSAGRPGERRQRGNRSPPGPLTCRCRPRPGEQDLPGKIVGSDRKEMTVVDARQPGRAIVSRTATALKPSMSGRYAVSVVTFRFFFLRAGTEEGVMPGLAGSTLIRRSM